MAADRQVRSRQRVADFGEVMTGAREVRAMCGLVREETERVESRFLDPACGSGNFLLEVLSRKLAAARRRSAGDPEAFEALSVQAVSSLRGIELLPDNAAECRSRLLALWEAAVGPDARGRKAVEAVLERNILWGDALALRQADGRPIVLDEPFDVILGNPPYQRETGGAGKQAKPVYPLFVEQAMALNPRYVVMLIPSRWFSGGFGLDAFRRRMLRDPHITRLVDYPNAKDCFPQNSVSGGVCYFLWSRDRTSVCRFTSVSGGERSTAGRRLDEFPVLVRYNDAVPVLRKVQQRREATLDALVSPLMPYGLPTGFRGRRERRGPEDLVLHASGGVSYIGPSEVPKGLESADRWRVLLSKTAAEHAGEPGRDGRFRVLTSSAKVIGPGEVCTHSYFYVGSFLRREQAESLLAYLKTRFARFLILLAMSSINLSRQVFRFVPVQEPALLWTDETLYRKYGLTGGEIARIERMIKPMA